MRQVVLDTETTGLEWDQGHRIIEIGCVELVGRRATQNRFHTFLNPGRNIDSAALEVHGIQSDSLLDKPKFNEVLGQLITFISGSELIIHNSSFDIGFLNHELSLIDSPISKIEEICSIQDTLQLARQLHPGQRNSLDALCKRYNVDSAHRVLHGALLDAELLADVFLLMTGGQSELAFVGTSEHEGQGQRDNVPSNDHYQSNELSVIEAAEDELVLHQRWLEILGKAVDPKSP